SAIIRIYVVRKQKSSRFWVLGYLAEQRHHSAKTSFLLCPGDSQRGVRGPPRRSGGEGEKTPPGVFRCRRALFGKNLRLHKILVDEAPSLPYGGERALV